MKNSLVPQKVGCVVGSFFGLIHFVWGAFVGLGFAQPLLNFVFRVHMMSPAPTVMPFSLVSTFILVLVTSCVGFAVGYVFAVLWNGVHR